MSEPCSESAPDGLIEVFKGEKDACMKGNSVFIDGKNGKCEIKAGETRYIEMPSTTNEFTWACDNTDEKFKYNSPSFNWVRCSRSTDTGRIEWTCYTKSDTADPNEEAKPDEEQKPDE